MQQLLPALVIRPRGRLHLFQLLQPRERFALVFRVLDEFPGNSGMQGLATNVGEMM